MNILVIIQFATLFVMSALLAGLDQWWEYRYSPTKGIGFNNKWYLRTTGAYPEVLPSPLGWFIMVGGGGGGGVLDDDDDSYTGGHGVVTAGNLQGGACFRGLCLRLLC